MERSNTNSSEKKMYVGKSNHIYSASDTPNSTAASTRWKITGDSIPKLYHLIQRGRGRLLHHHRAGGHFGNHFSGGLQLVLDLLFFFLKRRVAPLVADKAGQEYEERDTYAAHHRQKEYDRERALYLPGQKRDRNRDHILQHKNNGYPPEYRPEQQEKYHILLLSPTHPEAELKEAGTTERAYVVVSLFPKRCRVKGGWRGTLLSPYKEGAMAHVRSIASYDG